MNAAAAVWSQSALLAGVLLVLVVTLFHETLASMIDVWLRSDTFAHGALVVPVCAWLAWRKRAQLAALEPRAAAGGLVLLAFLALLWTLGRVAGVLVVEQAALVAMIPAIVWAVLGWQTLVMLAFPLGFLAFAVPFGEGLIPALMEFTATFTVKALELTGIPVYREGLHFSIPTGDFEVARACSGIRYLIASLALGTLYAHLTYRTFWRRVLFVALALVVPLLANGARAYLIVMIAYWSDMRLAVGVDHLIYGWLFFGIVMFALFAVGLTFRERTAAEARDPPVAAAPPTGVRLPPVVVALVAATIITLAPLGARHLTALPSAANPTPALPKPAAGWHGPSPATLHWTPAYRGAMQERVAGYRGADAPVDVSIVVYGAQTQGAELINSENLPYDGGWSASARARVHAAGRGVQSTRLHGVHGELLVWHWYLIGDYATSSDTLAQLRHVWNALRGAEETAAMIALATPVVPDAAAAEARLHAFFEAHRPALERCAHGLATGCAP
jgi:exosortase A